MKAYSEKFNREFADQSNLPERKIIKGFICTKGKSVLEITDFVLMSKLNTQTILVRLMLEFYGENLIRLLMTYPSGLEQLFEYGLGATMMAVRHIPSDSDRERINQWKNSEELGRKQAVELVTELIDTHKQHPDLPITVVHCHGEPQKEPGERNPRFYLRIVDPIT